MFCNFVTAPYAVPGISPVKSFVDNGLLLSDPAALLSHPPRQLTFHGSSPRISQPTLLGDPPWVSVAAGFPSPVRLARAGWTAEARFLDRCGRQPQGNERGNVPQNRSAVAGARQARSVVRSHRTQRPGLRRTTSRIIGQPLRKAFRERRRGQRAAIAREEELGYADCASARCACSRVAYTSAGSPAIGSAVGKRHVGRRDAGVGKGTNRAI